MEGGTSPVEGGTCLVPSPMGGGGPLGPGLGGPLGLELGALGLGWRALGPGWEVWGGPLGLGWEGGGEPGGMGGMPLAVTQEDCLVFNVCGLATQPNIDAFKILKKKHFISYKIKKDLLSIRVCY